MQFRTTELLLLGAMALPASGAAQIAPAPPAITRTVVAATKLPTVTDVPLHFKAVRTTLQPNEKRGISAATQTFLLSIVAAQVIPQSRPVPLGVTDASFFWHLLPT